jgi:hypothetical protein
MNLPSEAIQANQNTVNLYVFVGNDPIIDIDGFGSLASHRVQIAGMTPHFPKEFSMFWRNPTKTV